MEEEKEKPKKREMVKDKKKRMFSMPPSKE